MFKKQREPFKEGELKKELESYVKALRDSLPLNLTQEEINHISTETETFLMNLDTEYDDLRDFLSKLTKEAEHIDLVEIMCKILEKFPEKQLSKLLINFGKNEKLIDLIQNIIKKSLGG